MLRKVLFTIFVILALFTGGIYVFQDEAKSLVFASITTDMFLEEDLDDFDPGIATDTFPAINAKRNGESHTDLKPFSGSRGLVVLFNRSVVW